MAMTTALGAPDFKYASRKMPVLAPNGVVASSSALASQAGLGMLLRGGNAVDAAIATAVTIAVLEPWTNGIGADAFSIVWDGEKLHGLNGSGRAPATHTPGLFAGLGLTEMPQHGWLPVTVPGAPAAWRDLHARFGALPFETLFEPAISYAEKGWPLPPETAAVWASTQQSFAASLHGPEYEGWFSTFTPGGRTACPGDRWTLPDHASTLRRIAKSNSDDFYTGELAGRIADFAAKTGGYITREDLAAHTSTWVDPISASYRGFEVWEIPPNGQGIAALQALAILEGFEMGKHPRESVETYHLMIEAMKLAFADAYRYVADPEKVEVPTKGMLDRAYIESRRALIGPKAALPQPGQPPRGGTTYLCAADANGMMVSYIQSNYQGFGSGVVVPGTGIGMHNRGSGFVLEPGHPNEVGPGKRPFHTIVPAFLTMGGEPVGPFGLMGASMQPQGHMQLIVNQVDYGMNPQTALDAPRFRWLEGKQVAFEQAVPADVLNGLAGRGHQVVVKSEFFNAGFGRGQVIRRLADGGYVVGSEPRADGCASGY